jgi:uncharacterized protein
MAIGGRSGTGKSVLARGVVALIAPPPGAVILRSDVIRKYLFVVDAPVALPESRTGERPPSAITAPCSGGARSG